MVRLFVGLALPLSVREQLHTLTLMAGIPGVRWIAPQSYHITLCFIGSVGENIAEDIHMALSTIQAAPFTVEIIGTGAFSQRRCVHSLWAGIKYTPLLFSLQDKVEQAVTRICSNKKTTTRRYAPHITLARLNSVPTIKVQQFLTTSHLFRVQSFQVDRFILFVSHFSSDGAFYERVSDYSLEKVVTINI